MRGIRLYTDKGEYDYCISNNTTPYMVTQMFMRIHKGVKVLDTMLMPRSDVRSKGRKII